MRSSQSSTMMTDVFSSSSSHSAIEERKFGKRTMCSVGRSEASAAQLDPSHLPECGPECPRLSSGKAVPGRHMAGMQVDLPQACNSADRSLQKFHASDHFRQNGHDRKASGTYDLKSCK